MDLSACAGAALLQEGQRQSGIVRSSRLPEFETPMPFQQNWQIVWLKWLGVPAVSGRHLWAPLSPPSPSCLPGKTKASQLCNAFGLMLLWYPCSISDMPVLCNTCVVHWGKRPGGKFQETAFGQTETMCRVRLEIMNCDVPWVVAKATGATEPPF